MNYFKFAVSATDTHVVPASNIRALEVDSADSLIVHCTGNTYAANVDLYTITAATKAKAVQKAIISAANQPVNTSGAFIDVAAIDGVTAVAKSLAQ
jgi:hypothetical protein